MLSPQTSRFQKGLSRVGHYYLRDGNGDDMKLQRPLHRYLQRPEQNHVRLFRLRWQKQPIRLELFLNQFLRRI